MDTLLNIAVTTDNVGLITVTLTDESGDPISSVSRRFDVNNADGMVEWIGDTLKTATFAAVMAGAL